MTLRTNSAEQQKSLETQVLGSVGTVTRRRFLQALAAVGASVALPMPLETASVEAIETAWQRALREPWIFDVNEWGTIVEPGVKEPKAWSDLYSVSDVSPRDPELLIRQVEDIYPLRTELQERAEARREELELELESLRTDSARYAKLEQLIEDLSDPEMGWAEWIRQDGMAGIDGVRDLVAQWLNEPVDWAQSDYFPADWHGMGRAYRFFRQMDRDVLGALGVALVEGACPGSDYFAAELREDIDVANAKAVELGLPFRFTQEEVWS